MIPGAHTPHGLLLRVAGLLVATAVIGTACQLLRHSGSVPLSAAPPGALRLATHNVHFILLNRPEGRWSVADWERRRLALDSAFKRLDADAVAFQEMESFAGGHESRINLALDWLLTHNPLYAAAAVGDPGVFPSTQPILYRQSRLETLDQGWFFFSETPELIYSPTFDGSYPAFASWALFRDRDTHASFRVFNVHFDFSSRINRRRSAELLASRVAPLIASGQTVLLAGDLNVRAGSDIIDSLEQTGLTFLPVNGSTYHFARGLNLFAAIDHIAYGPGATALGETVVLRERFDGVWPSDHYPLVGDFHLE